MIMNLQKLNYKFNTEATKEEKGIDVFMVTTIVFGLTSVALLGLSIYLKKKTNS